MRLNPDVKVIDQYLSPHASIYHADTCDAIRGLPDNCADVSIFSPPFASLYTYSASDRDLGNSKGENQFAEHLAFIAREMFRVMRPGRLVCMHCMDLPTTLVHHGYIGFIDFPAQLREVYERAGFIYHSRITIWKDPEVAANRTYARQLTHGEMVKDSSMSGVGAPDYIIVMRKPGKNEVPIEHEGDALAAKDDAGKPRYWQRWASPVWGWPAAEQARLPKGTYLAGQVSLKGEEYPEVYAFTEIGEVHIWTGVETGWVLVTQSDARNRALEAALRRTSGVDMQPLPSPVWSTSNGLWSDGFVDYESPRNGNPDRRGIDQGDTLNFRAARENADERHICPLQVGVVKRLLELYSKKGETLVTPFMGIGTEVAVAIAEERKGIGFELKASYFRQAVEHVKRVEPGAAGQQTSLLDLVQQGTCKDCGEPGPVGQCECGGEVAP